LLLKHPPLSVHSVDVQAAAPMPEREQWIYEVKWDGYRALILKQGGHVQIRSRIAKDLAAATAEANLRHAAFLGVREDKAARSVERDT
jgi:ATP-dependent DNA ligase